MRREIDFNYWTYSKIIENIVGNRIELIIYSVSIYVPRYDTENCSVWHKI